MLGAYPSPYMYPNPYMFHFPSLYDRLECMAQCISFLNDSDSTYDI
ncbi:hypothetical protein Gotri_019379 [Gossypium trilobum]|uniref:Uncharacterized protein n=1 Tax=Gossypium trilobum TaxID=34281 RepID=A0A7J9EDF6_9ROSI|nr:hypothetical protein [Gossypium trilobum]